MTPFLQTACLVVLAASSAARASEPPRSLLAELRKALVVDGARAELADLRHTVDAGCQLTDAVVAPFSASGKLAVRLLGKDALGYLCEGWGWARVQVFAKTLVATRTVSAGASLEGAVALVERELQGAEPVMTELGKDVLADRSIAQGTRLTPQMLKPRNGRAGERVTVRVRVGAVTLEQQGHIAPCARGKVCALLSSGKRVQGHLQEGELILEET